MTEVDSVAVHYFTGGERDLSSGLCARLRRQPA
jgi:hypothetical protein